MTPEKSPEKVAETNVRSGWNALPHGHIPRPTFFPAGLAMGVTFLFWGLITSWVVCVVGVALLLAALYGWILEIRHEREQP